MKKNLRKAIMHRSKFKNCFNKCRTYENWCNYKTLRNYCVSLLRKTKQHLNLNDITDNKTFSRTIKPYFNEKRSGSEKIALSGNCKYYEQLLCKNHKASKFNASHSIQYDGHRANNLNF